MNNTSDRLVTVIGASGFIGRHIVRSLAKRGYRVRAACRRPDLAGHLLPLGTPGQIALVQANVRYPESLSATMEGADAVINVTGIDVAQGAQNFDTVLRAGTEAVARAARASGAKLLITVSGLGASADAASQAAQAKAAGEAAAAKAFPGAMVLRPSVVFGPQDRFFNKTAAMARFSPVLPVFGDGSTRIQPVFVGDVAEAAAVLVERGQATGKIYELGGPTVSTLKELMAFTLQVASRKRLLVPLPWGIARLLGTIAGVLPKPLITANQVDLMRPDNVVSEEAKREGRDLAGLGITPRSYQSIVPTYLYRYRPEGQFTAPSV